MTRYVALLRAVNLGSTNKVAMPALRELVRSLGHGDAETYLQSGNVVFSSDRADAGGLAAELRAAMADRLGLDVDVLLRTGDELAAVVAANPFPGVVDEPAKLHVVFLDRNPEPDRQAVVDPSNYEPDVFRFGARAVYVHYPNGAGRSKLNADVWRRLGVVATGRNWNTVTKLLALTNSGAGGSSPPPEQARRVLGKAARERYPSASGSRDFGLAADQLVQAGQSKPPNGASAMAEEWPI